MTPLEIAATAVVGYALFIVFAVALCSSAKNGDRQAHRAALRIQRPFRP